MLILGHANRSDFAVVRTCCKIFAQSWMPVWSSRFFVHVMGAIADTINFKAINYPSPLYELMWLCSVVGEFMVHGPKAVNNFPQRQWRHGNNGVHNDAGLLFTYTVTLVARHQQRRRRFPYFTALDWVEITHTNALHFGLI
jgi:hypothetical protein